MAWEGEREERQKGRRRQIKALFGKNTGRRKSRQPVQYTASGQDRRLRCDFVGFDAEDLLLIADRNLQAKNVDPQE